MRVEKIFETQEVVFLYLYCGYRPVLYVIIHYVSLTLSFFTETCIDR